MAVNTVNGVDYVAPTQSAIKCRTESVETMKTFVLDGSHLPVPVKLALEADVANGVTEITGFARRAIELIFEIYPHAGTNKKTSAIASAVNAAREILTKEGYDLNTAVRVANPTEEAKAFGLAIRFTKTAAQSVSGSKATT